MRWHLAWITMIGLLTSLPVYAVENVTHPVFQTRDDRAALADLRRLADAESAYLASHGTYTISLDQLSQPTFEPTLGIYVEVEKATTSDFRAVAMPRASTTARVFALETKNGQPTIYEMDGQEVQLYVLGAYSSIQRMEAMKLTLAVTFTLVIFGVAAYGITLHRRGSSRQWVASAPYFLSLTPLYVTLIFSTYLDEHTYIAPWMIGAALVGAGAAIASLGLGVTALWKLATMDAGFQLRRVALIGVLFALLGLVSPFYTFYHHMPMISDLLAHDTSHRILPP